MKLRLQRTHNLLFYPLILVSSYTCKDQWRLKSWHRSKKVLLKIIQWYQINLIHNSPHYNFWKLCKGSFSVLEIPMPVVSSSPPLVLEKLLQMASGARKFMITRNSCCISLEDLICMTLTLQCVITAKDRKLSPSENHIFGTYRIISITNPTL